MTVGQRGLSYQVDLDGLLRDHIQRIRILEANFIQGTAFPLGANWTTDGIRVIGGGSDPATPAEGGGHVAYGDRTGTTNAALAIGDAAFVFGADAGTGGDGTNYQIELPANLSSVVFAGGWTHGADAPDIWYPVILEGTSGSPWVDLRVLGVSDGFGSGLARPNWPFSYAGGDTLFIGSFHYFLGGGL